MRLLNDEIDLSIARDEFSVTETSYLQISLPILFKLDCNIMAKYVSYTSLVIITFTYTIHISISLRLLLPTYMPYNYNVHKYYTLCTLTR